jgi:hypothetical protein
MSRTDDQYKVVMSECHKVFSEKMADYGCAWRVLRPASITDQIFIKAQRIRSIEQKGVSRVQEGIRGEYVGVINYSVMALIQLELGPSDSPDLNLDAANALYLKHFQQAKDLMDRKNHDYSEAWRDMRRTSLTDIILVKLYRIKQIEDNAGKTSVSEGIDSNYNDIINYAVFSLIMMNEKGE